MLLNEIFGGLRTLAKTAARRTRWGKKFLRKIRTEGMYHVDRQFNGHRVEIMITPYHESDPSTLVLQFSIDRRLSKTDRLQDAQPTTDTRLTLFALQETIKLAARVLQEVKPKRLTFSAEVALEDDQALRRVNLYNRIVDTAKPMLEKLGYRVTSLESADTYAVDYSIVWQIDRVTQLK